MLWFFNLIEFFSVSILLHFKCHNTKFCNCHHANLGAIGYTGPLPDYLDADEPMEDTQFYSDEKVSEKEFSGEVEDDPEMAEMLKMLEDAKGDLEG